MTTITTTVFIKELSNIIYYSLTSNGPWNTISWPVTIMNPTTNIININFITDITLTNTNNYFIFGSDNGYVVFDGNHHRFFITNIIHWSGLIHRYPANVISTGYITIENFILNTVGNTTLQTNGGYLCSSQFGYKATGPINVLHCINNGSVNNNGCGGLFGYYAFQSSTGNHMITECINNGSIDNSGCGGLFGYGAFSSSSGNHTISECINNGLIAGTNCGGICGLFGENALGNIQLSIDMCINTGNITSSNSGGLIFKINNDFTYIHIQNCYSTGSIGSGLTGSASIVCQTPSNTLIDNCYIIYGDFTTSGISTTHSYKANETWDTLTAMTELTIEGTWAYDKTDGITNPA
jgi:hypothetical protein